MPAQTVGEAASTSLAATHILESHGIDPCAGGARELAEVCRERNINLESLLEELREAAAERTDWTDAPLRELIAHLTSHDHAIFRSELARLGDLVEQIAAAQADSPPVIFQLTRIFRSLRHELEVHMHHEEQDLFPVIARHEEAAEAGAPLGVSPFAAFGGPLHVMEMEHESAGAAMRLLRDVCNGYRPDCGSPMYRKLVVGLRKLEVKILVHMHLENNVLFPRAAAMRRRRTPI